MPLVTYIAPYDRFHGKVVKSTRSTGQVTYSSAKAGYVSRAQFFPSNPRSANQRRVRGVLTQLSRYYNGLSAAKIDAWNEAASQLQRTNILDIDYTLTGIGYFQMINFYKAIKPESVVTDPPDPVLPPTPYSVESCSVYDGAVTIEINTALDPAASDYSVYVRTTRPTGSWSRRARVNELSMIAPPISPGNHLGDVTSSVGEVVIPMNQYTLEVGDIIGISAILINPDGVPSRQLFVPAYAVTDGTP